MRKTLFILLILIILFIGMRLPGLSLPYHQDEYKTAIAVLEGASTSGQTFAHPPLTQIIYRLGGATFGPDHMRAFILCFATLGAILLYFVVRRRASENAALVTVLLYTISFYSIHASLMLDTDGAILPFFYLLSIFLYDAYRNANGRKKSAYMLFLLVSLITGFLVKLSFVLVVGAIILDFLWDYRAYLTRKRLFYGFLACCGFFFICAIAILVIKVLYPVFRIDTMVSHAASFMRLEGRGYMQTLIQGLKAIYFLSPILIIPVLFADREVFAKARVFFIHLVLGFVFYFVLFDFSSGALDKYLMFAIVPLSTIAGVTLAKIVNWQSVRNNKVYVFSGIFLAILLFCINLVPHTTLALYPKSIWFSNVLHLKWLMLMPFTGGSGPLGFYMSFLFIAGGYILTTVLALIALYKKEWRSGVIFSVMIIGLLYNAVFTEEFMFGQLHGSAPIALQDALKYVKASQDIKSVITYSDAGAYELNRMGKYGGRFYGVPAYEEGHKELFNEKKNSDHFLVVDMPKLYETGFYKSFFASCKAVYTSDSGGISAYVYDCRDAKERG